MTHFDSLKSRIIIEEHQLTNVSSLPPRVGNRKLEIYKAPTRAK